MQRRWPSRSKQVKRQAKREVPSTAGPRNVEDTTPDGTAGWVRRRDVLRSGLALAAVPSLAAFAPRSRPPRSPRWPRCWSCSGHALYTLPRDHKWHADGIYDTGLLQEWHYWTGFFTDDDTGEGLGVFYNINHQAVRPGVVQLSHPKTHSELMSVAVAVARGE